MVRIAFAIVLTILLAGCGPQWIKPGATDIEARVDQVRCEQEALAKIGKDEVTIETRPGYNIPATMRCNGGAGFIPGQLQMNCSGDPGKYVPPETVTIDTASGMRNRYIRECMYSNGWQTKRIVDMIPSFISNDSRSLDGGGIDRVGGCDVTVGYDGSKTYDCGK